MGISLGLNQADRMLSQYRARKGQDEAEVRKGQGRGGVGISIGLNQADRMLSQYRARKGQDEAEVRKGVGQGRGGGGDISWPEPS